MVVVVVGNVTVMDAAISECQMWCGVVVVGVAKVA